MNGRNQELEAPESAARGATALLAGLLVVEAGFVAAYLVDIALDHPVKLVSRLIDLDREATLPALFSAVQLLAIGAVFWRQGREAPPSARPARAFWLLAAGAFVFLSMDEALSIHERLTLAFKHVDWAPRFRGDHGVWIPIYGAMASATALLLPSQLRALWKRGPREFLTMALGAAIFVAGGAGLEIVSYEYLREGAPRAWYFAGVALEEFLEMAGASVILYGALGLVSPRRD